MKTRSQQAYSLLEILIALSIIALITLFMLPWSHELFAHKRSLLLRDRLVNLIRNAQQTAIALHMPIAFCQSNNQKQCGGSWLEGQLVFVNRREDGIVHHSKNILLRVSDVPIRTGHVYLRLFPHYRNYLLFSPDGMLTQTNGTFWYCAEDAKDPEWAIRFNRSGRPRVINPDKNGQIKTGSGGVLSCNSGERDA